MALQTFYSMSDLGRMPSPLPVDGWKSPGLAIGGVLAEESSSPPVGLWRAPRAPRPLAEGPE